MMSVAKIIEIVGSSEVGWEDAAQKAIDEAKKLYVVYTDLKLWI